MPRTDHLLRRVRRALRRISPLTPPAIPPAAPAINRTQRLLSGLDRSMALIEVGPSHAPLAPKRDGWRTTVVDHASRQDLARKYANQQLDVDRIEEVDVIWSGGDLASKFPPEALGSYDAILASHVMEHMPDPISFLISAQRLLKPAGRVILALPDRRYTFDYFEPMTTTADWLIAHENRAHTHSKRAAFNHMAYHVTNDAQATWRHSQKLDRLALAMTLQDGANHFDINTESGAGAHYHDYHAWHFTPSSFKLLVLESAVLRDIDLRVADCTPAIGHEFFATLARGRPSTTDAAALNAERLTLLKATVRELREGSELLVGA